MVDSVWRWRLVTSIHSPSLTPVWISVRTAWPSLYIQQKVLSPLWVGRPAAVPDARGAR